MFIGIQYCGTKLSQYQQANCLETKEIVAYPDTRLPLMRHTDTTNIKVSIAHEEPHFPESYICNKKKSVVGHTSRSSDATELTLEYLAVQLPRSYSLKNL